MAYASKDTCSPVSAGELREPISIESYTDSKGATGDPIITWAEVYAVNAKVEWVDGDEADKITDEVSETQVNFYIRTISALNSKMRIVYGGDTFDIKGVLKKGVRFQFMKILTLLVEP